MSVHVCSQQKWYCARSRMDTLARRRQTQLSKRALSALGSVEEIIRRVLESAVDIGKAPVRLSAVDLGRKSAPFWVTKLRPADQLQKAELRIRPATRLVQTGAKLFAADCRTDSARDRGYTRAGRYPCRPRVQRRRGPDSRLGDTGPDPEVEQENIYLDFTH